MNKIKKEQVKIDMLNLLLSKPVAVLKIKSGFVEQSDYVACFLRESDYVEIYRSSGRCPRAIVNISWEISNLKWILFSEGEAVALFGVVNEENKIGIPWMVATDKFSGSKIERYFIKNCKKYIKYMFDLGGYEMLLNCVDVDHKQSIRWLRWCGFTMEDIVIHGPFNKNFQKFFMPRSVH